MHCEPAEHFVPLADAGSPSSVQVKSSYPASMDISGTMRLLDLSTIPACDGAIIYLISNLDEESDKPTRYGSFLYINPNLDEESDNPTMYGSFCFPYGLHDPQFELLEKNLHNDFRVQGRLMKDIDLPEKPIMYEHSIFRGFLSTPLYTASAVEVQKDLPAHIELSPIRLRRKISESSNNLSFCPDDLSRYFVAFKDTLVTVCADREPNDGLAHRIDYRKDEIGQPTYRAE